MIEVNYVKTLPNFGLDLTFTSSERRRFDMRHYLNYPVFRRLENPGFFSLARIDYVTVTWPGNIDIVPETLYDASSPIDENNVHTTGNP